MSATGLQAKIQVWVGLLAFGGPGENPPLAFSSCSRPPVCPGLWPSVRLQKQQCSIFQPLSDPDPLPPSPKDLVMTLGPTWVIQEDLPPPKALNLVTSAESLFPCDVTHSQVWRQGVGLFGGCYYTHHTQCFALPLPLS